MDGELIDLFADQVGRIRGTSDELRVLVDETIALHDLALCEQVLARVADAYRQLSDGLVEMGAERMAAAARIYDDLERRG